MTQVIYEPSKVQQEAHLCDARELLYGGTAGCGKTVFLRMDPFVVQMYGEIERWKAAKASGQTFRSVGHALYLRREFPMLVQFMTNLLDTAFKIDPDFHWSSEYKILTHPCGFKYQLGHLQKDDDWRLYDSNEYCVAEGTEVLMANGSYKPIQAVEIGDVVATMEGPRPVVATHATGLKPCVAMTVDDPTRPGSSQTQVHPTTHPVLLSTTALSTAAPSRTTPSTSSQSREIVGEWQDYESLLCGRPRSEARRVSIVDRESACAEFGDERLAVEKLPELSVLAVLCAPVIRSDGTHHQIPSGSLGPCECSESSQRSGQETSLPARPTPSDPWPARRPCESSQGCASGKTACGASCARPAMGTEIGSPERCSSCSRPHGGHARVSAAVAQCTTRQPVDAESSTPTDSPLGCQERTRTDTAHSQRFYRHFYSGQARPVKEVVHTVPATLKFAGWFQTYDLTIASANHYITRAGIVNANTWIGFDEAIQFTEQQYQMLSSRLRTTDPVLMRKLRIRLASNPDAPAEGLWVKKRFVDPAPQGRKLLVDKLKLTDGTVEERTRLYIPARLSDNPNDSYRRDYETSLRQLPHHTMLARLEGRWDVVSDAFFAYEWKPEHHVVEPFQIPAGWVKGRAMDWGYKVACPVLWYAVTPDGDIVVYREVTFNHEVKEKDRKDAELVALAIRRIEMQHGEWDKRNDCSKLTGPADYQISSKTGTVGPSIEESMAVHGVYWQKSTKDKVASTAEFIRRLRDIPKKPGTRPGITFFNTCHHCIRTIPLIRTDPNNPEAPLDDNNNHWLNALQYMVMSRMSSPTEQEVKNHERSVEEFDENDALGKYREARNAGSLVGSGYFG